MNIGKILGEAVKQVVDQDVQKLVRAKFDQAVRKVVEKAVGDQEGKSAEKSAQDQHLLEYVNSKFSYTVEVSDEAKQRCTHEQQEGC